uniref:LRR receptor-like serine/threonine-protein kinase n=1 Tax=Ananas comosus var. bracteatus TaxID=296719 RepID=A0A6V7PPS8_ANACO|nr:unnamed protein product [Ananas comosus var. bracteatus]
MCRVPEQSTSAGSPPPTWAYDVYCFGKVLLELVTGKFGISASKSDDAATNEWLGRILPYVNINEKELITKIIDPSLIVDEDHLEEVWAVSIVAMSCLNPKPSKRPPVKYILKALENPLKVVREDNNNSSSGGCGGVQPHRHADRGTSRSWAAGGVVPQTSRPPPRPQAPPRRTTAG